MVKYVDEVTGEVVSSQWNSLDESTQNRIKGLGKILSIAIPAGSVNAIGKLKNTIHARRIDNLVANGNNNSADWANSQFIDDYNPPYTPGTQVTDFVSDGNVKFVRVVSSNRPKGKWVMKQSDIEGLTPQQIADKFALKYIPTGVTSIKPPAGIKIRTGEVNKNFGRSGGGTQFQLLGGDILKGWTDVTPL